MKLRIAMVILLLVLAFGVTLLMDASDTNGTGQVGSSRLVSPLRSALLGADALMPLPSVPDLPADKVALGRRLFFEPRLSSNDKIACASCHKLDQGGSDRQAVSVGIDGKKGQINAPTVFNSSLNFVQFWDGRAASLEEQAAGPVHNPLEMGSNWSEVIGKLSQDDSYRQAFNRIYKQGITGETIVDAIATYERTLLTLNSPFDRYLQGDKNALSPLELAGLRRFLDYGCASCHQGAGLGGNMFQQFGVMDNYFANRADSKADLGRFNVTGLESDRHVFKVPSLRNVEVTPPYFHDGSVASLEEAVVIMGRYQLGRDIDANDVKALTAFLRALTGEWEGKRLQ